MQKTIATISTTKEILDTYGLHTKKGFGQNFLIEPSVVERCAKSAGADGAVIEIGPGIGSLTQQLAKVSQKVRSFEVDDRLIPVLHQLFQDVKNIEIVHQDFMDTDIEKHIRELREQYGKVVVCANLPYYITTPILFKIFESKEPVDMITVMVQKEMADRFVAEVNSQDYSALSVECQYLYDVKRLFQVKRTCFFPAPNVDSTIIQFQRKEPIHLQDKNDFFEFVKICFKQRRKTLYNNIRVLYDNNIKVLQILNNCGFNEKTRAQELSIDQFIKLYKEYRYERESICKD